MIFQKSNVEDLQEKLQDACDHPEMVMKMKNQAAEMCIRDSYKAQIGSIPTESLVGLIFLLFFKFICEKFVQDLTSAGSSDTDSFMEELKELAKGCLLYTSHHEVEDRSGRQGLGVYRQDDPDHP